jgi:hypothetical protein
MKMNPLTKEELAKSYGEHLETGKLFLDIIPDHLKWSYMVVWRMVDETLKRNIDLGKDTVFNAETRKYARMMRMIFDVNDYPELIRNVYHAQLCYPEELGPTIDKDKGLVWLSLPQIINKSSPFRSTHCPVCRREHEIKYVINVGCDHNRN